MGLTGKPLPNPPPNEAGIKANAYYDEVGAMKEWNKDPDEWWELSEGARATMIARVRAENKIAWATKPKDNK